MQRNERHRDGEEICRSGESEYEPPENSDGDNWEAGWRRHAYVPRGAGTAERAYEGDGRFALSPHALPVERRRRIGRRVVARDAVDDREIQPARPRLAERPEVSPDPVEPRERRQERRCCDRCARARYGPH